MGTRHMPSAAWPPFAPYCQPLPKPPFAAPLLPPQVLSMQVYDMQDALGKDERMAAVQRVMVTATAQVGGVGRGGRRVCVAVLLFTRFSPGGWRGRESGVHRAPQTVKQPLLTFPPCISRRQPTPYPYIYGRESCQTTLH